MKNYKLTLCYCGCNKKYKKLFERPQPIEFEIISYVSNNKTKGVLELKRLTDNQIFKIGDNVQGLSITGKKSSKSIISSIQYVEEGFMKGFLQIHCWVIGYCAIFTIKNEKHACDNADSTDNFRLLQIINKIPNYRK